MMIERGDVIGFYECIWIFHCDSCDKDIVKLQQLVKPGEEWMADFHEHKPWECPNCEKEDYQPAINFGKRFTCPDCKQDNIQALEPSKIDGQCSFYSSTEITCMYCESNFGMCVCIDNDSYNPEYWLYRK